MQTHEIHGQCRSRNPDPHVSSMGTSMAVHALPERGRTRCKQSVLSERCRALFICAPTPAAASERAPDREQALRANDRRPRARCAERAAGSAEAHGNILPRERFARRIMWFAPDCTKDVWAMSNKPDAIKRRGSIERRWVARTSPRS